MSDEEVPRIPGFREGWKADEKVTNLPPDHVLEGGIVMSAAGVVNIDPPEEHPVTKEYADKSRLDYALVDLAQTLRAAAREVEYVIHLLRGEDREVS